MYHVPTAGKSSVSLSTLLHQNNVKVNVIDDKSLTVSRSGESTITVLCISRLWSLPLVASDANDAATLVRSHARLSHKNVRELVAKEAAVEER